MKKLADFLVEKRLWLFFASLAAAIVCLFLMGQVKINVDLTKYLPKDSGMRTGLDIMNREFPPDDRTATFRVMFEGLTDAQKQTVREELLASKHVVSVEYDPDSADCNSGPYALYLVGTDYPNTREAEPFRADLTASLSRHWKVSSYYENSGYQVLDILLPVALTIFLLVLLILCRSYIEVFLLLAGIGVSILLNTGTNVIFEDISDMTLSIAAVLQLVLSIDYSVMMFHRYEQEREKLGGRDNVQAMKNAVANAFSSVTGSAFTTMVGLLVLLLLRFTIGRDMGLVMAKGILCSLICVFTVMPTLILWCDGLLLKTSKARLRENRRRKREVKDHA